MTSQTLLQLLLVLHLVGFSTMAGTVLADFSINRRLNKYLLSDKSKALSILEGTALFPALIGIGVALLISTGIGMVIVLKGAVTGMLWFRVKMILVVLVMINGAGIMRKNGANLKLLLSENTGNNNGRILALKSRMTVAHSIQMILFLSIFILSIFRP
ncbi:hypothetical protein Q4E93_09255 [Flavitalea sp. BT771]|uniref:hypothetical protein n=1 Tax=Flavitalea sp. BT771 TaxID=3063329 RepID=UPI0026E2DE24|nr:hypothetical protein [Flavitalea sp. BT771]MDO6430775.1 hypothetical protein [Flavitalea sp. BT771]MDV6219085.1 hypothetical protein [Flavitalea sp. BT771]